MIAGHTSTRTWIVANFVTVVVMAATTTILVQHPSLPHNIFARRYPVLRLLMVIARLGASKIMISIPTNPVRLKLLVRQRAAVIIETAICVAGMIARRVPSMMVGIVLITFLSSSMRTTAIAANGGTARPPHVMHVR